ncbi:MAG: hypothetical protein R2741_07500 [Methanolobus sp.]
MKNKRIQIFATVAVILMIFSIVPAMAFTDADSLQEKIKDRDRINATTDAGRYEVTSQIKQAASAQERYNNATENFLRIKAGNSALNTEEAIEATKEYLNSTIDVMTEALDNEEYIEQLNEEKEDVATSSTRAELAECAKNIRDIWREARQEKTDATAESANNKLKAVIRSSEAMSLRLENEISLLEKKGEDVSGLQEMHQEYNNLVTEAGEYQEQAENAYGNGNANAETFRYMKLSGQSIRQANAVLEEMFRELKQYREGIVTLDGEGTFTAEGDGIAVVSGEITMSITANNATLIVKDMEGDAKVNTDDATYSYSNIDSGNSDIDNRAYVYQNLTGEVTVEGTRLTVTLRGTDVSLDVEGTGNAVLTGEGTYEIAGTEYTWTAPDASTANEEDEVTEETTETEEETEV